MGRKPYKKINCPPKSEEIIIKPEEPMEEVKLCLEDEGEPVIERGPLFVVKVTYSSLRKRLGPGIDFDTTGLITDMGVYGIYEKVDNWGRLKDESWICLDYTKIV